MAEPGTRAVVLGREVAGLDLVVPGLALVRADGGPWPEAVRAAGESLTGLRLTGLTGVEQARLDFFLAVLGQEGAVVPVGEDEVRTHLASGAGVAWDLADWRARYAATFEVAARDIMALQGRADPVGIRTRLGSILVRASSAVRAARSAPTALRHRAGPNDMVVAETRQPYARFFAVEEYDVAWRRFDGRLSDTVTRAAFLSGDAVTVLPYDPGRDRVLVVEQFRAGPHARGDAQCWQIEAIAGRIDPGERAEAAARREAVEEAGLDLADLLEVARYYPSPGAVSEYLYSYVALTDLPDGSAGVFGVEGETEDIRGHLIGFDRLMDLVGSGEIENAPLILTALWLQRERARLRGHL